MGNLAKLGPSFYRMLWICLTAGVFHEFRTLYGKEQPWVTTVAYFFVHLYSIVIVGYVIVYFFYGIVVDMYQTSIFCSFCVACAAPQRFLQKNCLFSVFKCLISASQVMICFSV